ncbi:MAG: GDSL family lipase [bacterium]|nr:GDSL family lipase [bacterium]
MKRTIRRLGILLVLIILAIIFLLFEGEMVFNYGYKLIYHSAVLPERVYDEYWEDRFNLINERVRNGNVELVFLGDSITHGWEGAGKRVWKKYYGHRNAVNMGILSDKTENVLWRINNGHFRGIYPRVVVLLIGTNNQRSNTAEEISEGIKKIVDNVLQKKPKAKVLILGVFPCWKYPSSVRRRLKDVNRLVSRYDNGNNIRFLDVGYRFTDDNGVISQDIMEDYLHLTPKGYRMWAETMEPTLKMMLGEKW